MPLPEEVHQRLQARAATDLDLASLLAIVKKPNETVGEPPLDELIQDAKAPNETYRVQTRWTQRRNP
jgi:hypothetical protein